MEFNKSQSTLARFAGLRTERLDAQSKFFPPGQAVGSEGNVL